MSVPKEIAIVVLWIALCPAIQLEALAQSRSSVPTDVLSPVTVDRLSNGIRVIHLAALPSDSTPRSEIAFGYTVGVRNEPGYPRGVANLAQFVLASSVPARSVALAAHLGGGEFEFVVQTDRIGMRATIPPSLKETVFAAVAAYFDGPDLDPDLFEYARRQLRFQARPVSQDFTRSLREAIGRVLLGEYPYLWSDPVNPNQIDGLKLEDLDAYFGENLGTDRAYLVVSEPLSQAVRDSFEAIEGRWATHIPFSGAVAESVQTTLDFPSRQQGGVVLATRVPSVHFETWFKALVVDRMLRQIVGGEAVFEFVPGVDPVMHRVEFPVRIPQFTEDVRTGLLDQIAQLQAQNPSASLLGAAITSARTFLAERDVREWFAAHDLWSSLEAGWETIGGMTEDGFRAATRDFAGLARVIATWSPAFEQPVVTVESLGDALQAQPEEAARAPGRAPGVIDIPFLNPSALPEPRPIQVERLDSGVTLGEDADYSVFIAGRFQGTLPGGEPRVGPNGTLWSFAALPGDAVFEGLEQVRPDRILLLAPSSDHAELRQRLENWESGTLDSTPSLAQGPVSSGDLTSLLVLKTWLDAKVIEAGWWGQVALRIDSVHGSLMMIEAGEEQTSQIRTWIFEVAEQGLSDEEFLGVRRAASGYYDRIRRELQILLWQRDPRGTLPLPSAVNQARLRDVARIYF